MKFVLFCLVVAQLLTISFGASCADYSSSSTCATNSLCAWVNGACSCSSEVPLDIMFMLDASGSVGSNGYSNEKQFVSDLVTNGVGNESRVSIMRFASSDRISITWSFTDSQTRSVISSHVTSLGYPQGATAIKTALQVAVNEYTNNAGSSGNERLLMLITDGNPWPSSSQNPCPPYPNYKPTLDSNNIKVVVIGVGNGWTPSIIDCLVDDPTNDMIQASSFSNLDAVRTYTDSFTCPSTVEVEITEVRPVGDSSQTDGRQVAFVEFQNTGSDIDLEANSLQFSGMFTATLDETVFTSWAADIFLVVYDPSSGYYPDCFDCSCSDDVSYQAGTQCPSTQAIYLACDSSWGCSWQSTYSSSAISKTNWGMTVVDLSDTSTLSTTAYSSANSWPSIVDYYSYENNNIGGDTTDGLNWQQSCWPQGTPGEDILDPCTKDCTESVCQGQGDTSAICSLTLDDCVCSTGYFASGGACYPYDAPPACSASIYTDTDIDTDPIGDITWTAPAMSTVVSPVIYVVTYEGGSATVSSIRYHQVLDVVYTSWAANLPTVKACYPDTGTCSANTTCDLTTSDPTPQPTPSPTYSIPTVSCSVFFRSDSLTISWTTPTLNPPDDPSSVDTFRVYYFTDAGDSSLLSSYDSIIDVSGNTYLASGSGLVKESVSVRVAAYVYEDGTDYTVAMFNSSTECPIYTPVPTNEPTPAPTLAPVVSPSNAPTPAPTGTPTYTDGEINDCELRIQQGGDSFTIYAEMDAGCSPECSPHYKFKVSTDSSTRQVFGIDINDTVRDDESNVILWGEQVSTTDTWTLNYEEADAADASYSQVSTFDCTIVTIAPTSAPTDRPTDAPSNAPVDAPTNAPTSNPVAAPTATPTYTPTSVTDCIFTLPRRDTTTQLMTTFDIEFDQPDFDGSGGTPNIDDVDVRFRIDWGTSGTTTLGRSGSGTQSSTIDASTVNIEETDDVCVLIQVRETGDVSFEDNGDCTDCTQVSYAPSDSPTSEPTTPSPTYENPVIWLDAEGAGCTLDEIPTCEAQESELEAWTIDLGRSVPEFAGNLTYSWKIYYSLSELESDDTDDDSDDRRRLVANAYDIDGADYGNTTIVGFDIDTSATRTHSIWFINENSTVNAVRDLSSGTEYFWLRLEACYGPPFGTGHTGNYECSIGDDEDENRYSTVRIQVGDGNPGSLVNTKTGDLPTWIWYPIAIGIVLLPLLAWGGYRMIQKRKMAEEMQEYKKKELDDAENMDDFDNFGGVGDDVRFNPLATGGAAAFASGGDFIDNQLAQNKQGFENANVDVHKEVFKQEFGQQRLTRV